MKTQSEKLEEKAKIIQTLGTILDKHCADRNDVYYVVRALREWSEFMANQRFAYDSAVIVDFKNIGNIIKKNHADRNLSVFEDMSESVSEAIILGGQNAEAINIINEMNEDLSSIMG